MSAMNNKGSILTEVMFSLSIFCIVVLVSFSALQNTIIHAEHTMNKWQAFWLGKDKLARWKSGMPVNDHEWLVQDKGFSIELEEHLFTEEVEEGVITVSWQEGEIGRSVIYCAYRVVSP